jgi:hypothetical protein
MKYSSDGHDEKLNEVIEIKCMGDKNHNKILEYTPEKVYLPEEWAMHPLHYYNPQMQWAMLISGAKACHFIAYNPSHPKPYKRVVVLSDEKKQSDLMAKAKVFWALVQTKTPPDLTDDDFEVVEDEDLNMHLLERQYLKAVIASCEGSLKMHDEQIKKIVGNKNIITKNGAKVFTTLRKGSIEYANIPELKNVDLEPYRKGPVAVFNIKG